VGLVGIEFPLLERKALPVMLERLQALKKLLKIQLMDQGWTTVPNHSANHTEDGCSCSLYSHTVFGSVFLSRMETGHKYLLINSV